MTPLAILVLTTTLCFGHTQHGLPGAVRPHHGGFDGGFPRGPHGTSGGLYLSSSEVLLACTSTTSNHLGAKLARAIQECTKPDWAGLFTSPPQTSQPPTTPGTILARKVGRPINGHVPNRRGKCPSMAQIKREMTQKMKNDLCIVKSMGWVDQQGEFISASFDADIGSLPTMVSNQLSKLLILTCAKENVQWIQKGKKYKRCSKKRTAEQINEVTNLMMIRARSKCFKEIFQRSCGNFIRTHLLQHMQDSTATTNSYYWTT